MAKIQKNEKIATDTFMLKVYESRIASKAKPGNFVVIRTDKKGERIPLSIASSDSKSITIVYKPVGKTTKKLARMKPGQEILDIVGPLGNATEIKKFGNVCLVGGGIGIAALYPVAKAMHAAGNKVIIILGIKNKKTLFWDDKFKKIAHSVHIVSEDGSIGREGNIINPLRDVLNHRLDLVYAVGPTPMMKAVAKYTYQRVRTIVSLDCIMLDGIGMCGCCRVTVKGKTMFSCVDGPEFNAHDVEWEELLNRKSMYEEEEHSCKLEKKIKVIKEKTTKTKPEKKAVKKKATKKVTTKKKVTKKTVTKKKK